MENYEDKYNTLKSQVLDTIDDLRNLEIKAYHREINLASLEIALSQMQTDLKNSI